MKKIAFFTPLHPLKTGIADYVEEMLPYMRKKFQIDLFIDESYEASEQDTILNHNIYKFSDFVTKKNEYDMVVYQMGNNKYHEKIYEYLMKYPGMVVLHDYAIHHLIANIFYNNYKSDTLYFDEVEFNHGSNAKNIAYKRACDGELGLWETDAVSYPMNKRVLSKAISLITFSEFSKINLEKYDLGVPIKRIFLHCGGKAQKVDDVQKNKVRKNYGIKPDSEEMLFCVFGFVTPSKRPYSIIEAFTRLVRLGKKVRLVFVGEVHDACKDLKIIVRKNKIEHLVSFTGFVDIETFKDYLISSDICISLRYPTMGETSGVLMRALGMGKPSIVTNIGTFKEFSDDMLIKVSYGDREIDDIEKGMLKLISDKELYNQMSNLSYEYAKEHLEIAETAKQFCDFVDLTIAYKNMLNNKRYQNMKSSLEQFSFETGISKRQLSKLFDSVYEEYQYLEKKVNYGNTCDW